MRQIYILNSRVKCTRYMFLIKVNDWTWLKPMTLHSIQARRRRSDQVSHEPTLLFPIIQC